MNHDRIDARPWFILGCGYTGQRLARRLCAAGALVTVSARTREGAEALPALVGAGVSTCIVDLADATALPDVLPAGAILVDSVPPGEVPGVGESALIEAASAAGVARVVYLASTGMYPVSDGAWVDERTLPAPAGEHGRARLAAETALLAAATEHGLDAVSLRIAAIYGPGRGVVSRIRAGNYRILGAGDTYVSRVHVDDLAAAVIVAGVCAQLPHRIYNVADDEPSCSRAFADAVATELGIDPVPSVAAEEFSATAQAMLGANRRISNARLRSELGFRPQYPTWREGIRQIIDEEST